MLCKAVMAFSQSIITNFTFLNFLKPIKKKLVVWVNECFFSFKMLRFFSRHSLKMAPLSLPLLFSFPPSFFPP